MNIYCSQNPFFLISIRYLSRRCWDSEGEWIVLLRNLPILSQLVKSISKCLLTANSRRTLMCLNIGHFQPGIITTEKNIRNLIFVIYFCLNLIWHLHFLEIITTEKLNIIFIIISFSLSFNPNRPRAVFMIQSINFIFQISALNCFVLCMTSMLLVVVRWHFIKW